MICAEMPLAAAKDGLFPERFKRLSGAGVPTLGVVISTVRASVAVILGATHVIRLGPRWSRFAKA